MSQPRISWHLRMSRVGGWSERVALRQAGVLLARRRQPGARARALGTLIRMKEQTKVRKEVGYEKTAEKNGHRTERSE